MRLLISIVGLGLVAALMFTGCNSNEQTGPKIVSTATPASPVQLPPPADNARRITPAELKDELAKNDAVIIDVRNDAAYKAGHIKGARLIPSTDILAHVDELPRNKLIVTYCS